VYVSPLLFASTTAVAQRSVGGREETHALHIAANGLLVLVPCAIVLNRR
jgi:hypothetical protein